MKEFIVCNGKTIKPGMYLRIDHMDDCDGKDWAAALSKGKIGVIKEIDDAGHIHGSWGGLAVLPDVDTFTVSNKLDDLLNKPNLSVTDMLNNAVAWIDEHCADKIDFITALQKIGFDSKEIEKQLKETGRI